LKAVWFAENEIKEPMKCEICGEVFKKGFVIEPESEEDVKRLQKRFPFVTDIHHSIFVSKDCLIKNFSNKTQLLTSKGVKLLMHEDYPTGEI